jgi:hypothetical protein
MDYTKKTRETSRYHGLQTKERGMKETYLKNKD